MPDVFFHGGACDGRTVDVDDAQLVTERAVCNGQQYDVYGLKDAGYIAFTVGTPAPSGAVSGPGVATGGAGVLGTSSALGGWNRMIRTLSRGLPQQLDRCEQARRVIRGAR